MAGVLEGVKIVEMGHVVAIPAAAALMADCGAEVIKIEPHTGDQSRRLRGTEFNPGFYLHNRSKKGSIAIDLRQDAGREIVYRLVRKADIFLTNYERSSLLKLKMDYETLNQFNPKLVYGLFTAYGSAGPMGDEGGYDFAAGYARAGVMYMLSSPGTPPPGSRPGWIDRVGTLEIIGGVLAALLHKEKTGKGQKVEFNLYHTGVWVIGADMMDALVGVPLRRADRTQAETPFFNTYETKDGRWFQLTAGDRYIAASDPTGTLLWSAFCRAADRPDLENDPKFKTREARGQHSKELLSLLDEIFASKTYEEWDKSLLENKIMYSPVLSPLEVITDSQALANNFFSEVEQPGVGRIKLINMPIKFYQDPASIRGPAPDLGEHTDEILSSVGYSSEEVSQLRKGKVIL